MKLYAALEYVLKVEGRRGLGLIGVFCVVVRGGWAIRVAIAIGLRILTGSE